MKKFIQPLLLVLLIAIVTMPSKAEERKNYHRKDFATNGTKGVTAAGCSAGSSFEFLEVNNVRMRVNTGGDMWWDLAGDAAYFIPANTTKTSLFATALWIGGVDVNDQLKIAAQRYRQDGIDFWTGPLTVDDRASIEPTVCAAYDRMFRITKAEVQEFIGWFTSDNKDEEYPGYAMPTSIKEWPAHPYDAPGAATYLAPFFDYDGDGEYNPDNGDYPYYDFDNELCPLNFAGVPGWIPEQTMGSTGTIYDPVSTESGGILSDQVLHGDETLWWVFNDKGNAHTETNGDAIGLEVRAHAFAFSTSDEINNMTFLSYEIINRSTFVLNDTYFGIFTDPDVGYGKDDFVGCDVGRGMGYCYNGTPIDGTGEPQAYGANPPAVGVDFFQGPYMDPDGYDNPAFRSNPLKGPSFHNYKPDGNFVNECEIVTSHNKFMDMKFGLQAADYIYDTTVKTLVKAEAINGVNFGDGIVDNERFGMRRFVYFINDQCATNCDPDDVAIQHYNYLVGLWKDGTPMYYGGPAYGTMPGVVGPECHFMFPDNSDPCNWGTNGVPPNGGYNTGTKFWNEHQSGNNPNDRRFIQSAGPFTLQPGAVNYITLGVPWARANTGIPWSSVEELQLVDDKCQALFENCFKVIDGPDAPDLSFVEMDRKLICLISNEVKTGNNYHETYQEVDNTITQGDSLYRFEGYQIYQVINNTVGPEELNNSSKARLVAQYDVVNGVGRIINFEKDEYLGYDVPVEKVSGNDLGIKHSFEIETDYFPIGNDNKLINNRNYYYVAVAYAYNNYQQFYVDSAYLGGQKSPYLSGRNNIKIYTVMPHKTVNGIVMNSSYGDIPQVTRVEGQGNGGIMVNLSKETIDEIMSKEPASATNTYGMPTYPIAYKATYEVGAGPVAIKVVDPLNVKANDYRLKFINCHETNVRFSKSAFLKENKIPYIDTLEWVLLNELNDTLATSYDAITVSINDTTGGITKPMYYSDSYEQVLTELGISIHIKQVLHPGDYFMTENGNNGLIESTATFADSSVRWLSGFPDIDEPESAVNWIRSGSQAQRLPSGGGESPVIRKKSDYDVANKLPWDPYQVYEKIFNGTWAPAALTAALTDLEQQTFTMTSIDENISYAPNFTYRTYGPLQMMNSVDIVLTPDKSKWTRALVVEQSWDNKLSENGRTRFYPRAAKSVDKNGNSTPEDVTTASNNPEDPNYLSADGMGWFPGYAINIETGERLNIMFGENSYFAEQNGRDMLFNPTSNNVDDHGGWVFGGMHYVYVMSSKHVSDKINDTISFDKFLPAYDGCVAIKEMMDIIPTYIPAYQPVIQKRIMDLIYGSCMYIGQPCPAAGYQDKWLDNDFTLRIRVMKPYSRYFGNEISESTYPSENGHWPLYTFTTKGLEPTYNESTKIEEDLDKINVVPNPYYAYAGYETGATDNRIKITNLPQACTVTIYNVGGTVVRQFKKASADPNVETYIEWDLKNFAGVPISSGVYLIHVRYVGADGKTRDRVIKWFGVIRTVDLFTF